MRNPAAVRWWAMANMVGGQLLDALLTKDGLMTDSANTLFRSINPPLIVVTTASGGQTAGCVAGFHTQCSIDPVRYAVWLSKANHTYRVVLFATHVAVHFLDATDHGIAELFGGSSGDDVDKFADIAWSAGPGAVPLLDACPNRIVLRRTTVWDDGGDHVCVIGEPVDASVGARPLTLMRVMDADDIDSGHKAGSRGTPHDLTSDSDSDSGVDSDVDSAVDVDALEDIAAGSGHAIDLPGGH